MKKLLSTTEWGHVLVEPPNWFLHLEFSFMLQGDWRAAIDKVKGVMSPCPTCTTPKSAIVRGVIPSGASLSPCPSSKR